MSFCLFRKVVGPFNEHQGTCLRIPNFVGCWSAFGFLRELRQEEDHNAEFRNRDFVSHTVQDQTDSNTHWMKSFCQASLGGGRVHSSSLGHLLHLGFKVDLKTMVL